MDRIFLRCKGCLQVAAVDGKAPPRGTKCTVCEGDIDYMGRVHESRLVKTEERCPCDARCTSAGGPTCDCACGGKNHGSNMLVTVTIDAGGIPRITPLKPEKARAIFAEFTAAKAETQARLEAVFPEFKAQRAGERLDGWARTQAIRGSRYEYAIRRAAGLKTHHGRMATLKKIEAEIAQKAVIA